MLGVDAFEAALVTLTLTLTLTLILTLTPYHDPELSNRDLNPKP